MPAPAFTRSLVAILSVGWACVVEPCPAWSQSFTPLSLNGTYSQGLTSWTGVRAVTTAAFPQAYHGYDVRGEVIYGGSMLRLPGTAYAYQIVPLSGDSQYHLLNCAAYKQRLSGADPLGWAGMGVIYYDAQWGVIDEYEQQFFTAYPSDRESPFRPCSLGIRVPVDAAFAIMWVANDGPNTQAFIDDFKLYDYQKSPLSTNLLAFDGSTIPITFDDEQGELVSMSGLQFWSLDGFVDTASGYIGNVGKATWIAQEVSLAANDTCNISLYNVNETSSSALPNFGVDYFDANWNRISGVYRTASPSGEVNFSSTAPPGTAHTIVWVWVRPLAASEAPVGPVIVQATLTGSNLPRT